MMRSSLWEIATVTATVTATTMATAMARVNESGRPATRRLQEERQRRACIRGRVLVCEVLLPSQRSDSSFYLVRESGEEPVIL
mmetsp:Transcript_9394/g.25521  ORF Transcript_9394/g.25521 Transcript_9394/m.25521 type:complete len:83 (+) Transcript_9394:368-616(+)